jgi:hypothetical protein
VFAAVDKADRVYGLDPKVARKKEGLLIRQGVLSREIALADKEIKKKGGEKLRKLDEQIYKLEKIAGTAERVPEHGYHSQVAKTANSKNGYRWILGKERRLLPLLCMPVTMSLLGSGQVSVFPNDLKLSPPIRKIFPKIKYWWISRTKTLLIHISSLFSLE